MMQMQNLKGKRRKFNLWSLLKRSFWTGIAALFPLFITGYTIVLVFRFADNFVGKYINLFIFEQYGITIPGIGLIVLLLILIIVGLLSRIFLGRWLAAMIDRLFKKIPLIASIYPSAKQLSNFLFSREKKERFKKVVLVQYPYQGSYALGFITNESIFEFDEKIGQKLVNIFVPLAPAPFSGIIVMVPKNKIEILDISVDQAIKFIVSGGVVAP